MIPEELTQLIDGFLMGQNVFAVKRSTLGTATEWILSNGNLFAGSIIQSGLIVQDKPAEELNAGPLAPFFAGMVNGLFDVIKQTTQAERPNDADNGKGETGKQPYCRDTEEMPEVRFYGTFANFWQQIDVWHSKHIRDNPSCRIIAFRDPETKLGYVRFAETGPVEQESAPSIFGEIAARTAKHGLTLSTQVKHERADFALPLLQKLFDQMKHDGWLEPQPMVSAAPDKGRDKTGGDRELPALAINVSETIGSKDSITPTNNAGGGQREPSRQAQPQAGSTPTGIYRAKLRKNLVEWFDDSELRDLCFDMGMDYESLKGESKSDKARELLAYCERRQIVPDLVTKCRELRPKVSWEGEYE